MAAGSVVKTLPADVLLVAELAALDLNRVFSEDTVGAGGCCSIIGKASQPAENKRVTIR